jgi:transcriptional regulator with XRE-family HTH domain
MDIHNIRTNIKLLRRSKDITQKEMAVRLFMDERTYAKIERGEKKSLDIMLLLSIADILNTDISMLLQSCGEQKHLLTTEKNNTKNNTAAKPDKEVLEEMKQLKQEIKDLIACHKEALSVIKSFHS